MDSTSTSQQLKSVYFFQNNLLRNHNKSTFLFFILLIISTLQGYGQTYHNLSSGSFSQNWANTGLITTNDDWSGIPSIRGFLGQDITTATGINPGTLLGVSGVANDLDVIANQTATTLGTGGVAEFQITDPTIALQGSGTADAPHIIIYLNSSGRQNIVFSCNLRDIDGTTDNAIQPIAFQYRIGGTGNFTNLPASYIADASTGPSLATLITPISFTLPVACENQANVEIRVITTNAVGNDEWIGIDDIAVTSDAQSLTPNLSINDVTQIEGDAGTTNFIFTVSLSTPAPAGGVTFDITTNNNTATTADNDYVAKSLTGQTIPQGSSTYSFTTVCNGDATIEPTESFFVDVSNVVGATVTDAQGLGTITNDDVAITPIHNIQGAGNTSPLVGQSLSTRGIVTGVKSNGFFLQEPDATVDADPNTSEGIFVFTSSAPPVAAAIGNKVQVTATVVEFVPSTDPYQPALSELSSPTVLLLSTGNPLPAPITLTTTLPNSTGGIYQLEKYEGMRVTVASLTVVAPTEGFKSEANATSTSTGVFYGVVTGNARPYRETGVIDPNPVPSGSIPPIPRYDGNPELIRIDSDSQTGTIAINVSIDAVVSGITGPLDYSTRYYTILPDASSPPMVTGGGSAIPVADKLSTQFTVASYNLERFFDTVDDPAVGEVILTATAYANRKNKASLAIRNILKMPDILAVVEMENLTTLQDLSAKISADAIAASQTDPQYQAYLVEGNDVGGIDVGFLVKTGITVNEVVQELKNTHLFSPTMVDDGLLNDRPPLRLSATVNHPSGKSVTITVIVNHLRSLLSLEATTPGSNGWTTDGERVRGKRQKQAEDLANLIQTRQTNNPNEKIIVLGDFNAFQFNDGFVDMINVIKGTPTPDNETVVPGDGIDLVTPDLVSPAITGNPYSYTFNGTAQIIDHVMISGNLTNNFAKLEYPRIDADFPEILRSDPNRPEKISDHDPALTTFNFCPPSNTFIATGVTVSSTAICSGASVSLSATCATGIVTWYNQMTGGVALGTGSPFAQNPTANTTYYAECVDFICVSDRVATSTVTIITAPLSVQVPFAVGQAQMLLDADGNSTLSNSQTITSLVKIPPISIANLPLDVLCTPTFFDGFENGCFTPTWSVGSGSQTFSVENSNSAQGTYHLQGVGGVSTHLGGLSTSIPSATPSEMSWYIYPQGTGATNYVVVGNNAISATNNMFFQYWQGGNNIRFVSSYTLVVPATPNAWYFVQLKNINFTTHTFDVYINNTLQATAFPFRSNTVNYVTKIHLYNFNNGTAKWDNILVGAAPLPSPTGTSNPTICSNTTTSLSATCATGTVNWYDAGGTALQGTGSPFVTPNLTANTTYKVRCEDGACMSLFVDNLVTINNVAAPTSTSNPAICSNTTTSLSATCLSGTVNWYDAGGTTLQGTGSPFVTPNLTANTTYKVRCEANCNSTFVDVTVSINPLPSPNVVSNSPLCEGSILNLSASGGVIFAWTGPNGFNSTSETPSISNISLSGGGTYTLTVTDGNGCSATATSSVTIYSRPSPTSSSNAPLVIGQTLNLSSSGGVSYLWAGPNSFTSTMQNPSISNITLNNIGAYTISVTDINGCTATSTTPVLVLENIGSNTPCVGGTLNLSGTGTGDYLWTGPNSFSSTLQNPSISNVTIANAGVYTFTLDNSGRLVTVTLNITINPLPIPNITTNSPLCAGLTLNLSGSGGGNYLWEGPNSFSSTSQNPSITNTTTNESGTYTLTVTDGNSCSASATSSVIINAIPSAPTISSPSQLIVCSPTTLTLTATCTTGTVIWSNAATGTSLTLSAVGTYSITATCTSLDCVSDASAAVLLEIKAKPVPPAITPPSSLVVCSPTTLTLTATCSTGNVVWSDNSTGTTLTLNAVGTYTISAKCFSNGCDSDQSASTSLEIKAKPVPPIITQPSQLIVCSPTTLTLTATCATGTVTWSDNSTGTILTLSAVGTYSISANCTLNGCVSDASAAVLLEIKAKPVPPAITPPSSLVVCSPTTLTLTATCSTGNVVWSDNSTGTSLTLNAVGTYTISAKCISNGCDSDQSASTSLEIKAKPVPPIITQPSTLVVCLPNTLTLTATCATGTVTWSDNSTGTSLTLSAVGTYSISANCTLNGCVSDASAAVLLEIKAKPVPPAITPPSSLVVCSPTTLTLTATCSTGNVVWSDNSTGTSLTLNAVGTYSISAKCISNGCDSDQSASTSLEIKAKPVPPIITQPSTLVICSPTTLTLTATCTTGTVTWSDNSTGTSLTLSAVGTYSITAKCTLNGCDSDQSSATDLEIKALPNAQASNTGPYSFGQTINLSASGGSGTPLATYSWSGPNSFSSTIVNPSIFNAQIPKAGIYSVTVTNVGCSATATTEVIVSGIDPCVRILAYDYVLAGNPSQTLFSMTNGQNIAQRPAATSIIVRPICNTVTIGSVDMTITGPSLNWTILQNVEPFALFDNSGPSINGQVLAPGTYSLTVTGYAQDARAGGTTYGPIVTTFTILGNAPTISMPTFTGTEFCAGTNVNVSFTTTGTFAGGNLFQVLLSDANGNFNSPQIIGTTTVAGSVLCNIPPLTMGGENYRIKVVSTDPAASGNYSPVALTVNPLIYNLVSPTNDYPFGTATKKAIETINARNNITGASRINYKAGNAINLTPGFQVVSGNGSSFKAQIEGCSN